MVDITEFTIPAGKGYLFALVYCFDGTLLGWAIGTTPDSALVNTMIDHVITQLPAGKRPIIHSDRECHYQWPGWIERMKKASLEHPIPKKGCPKIMPLVKVYLVV